MLTISDLKKAMTAASLTQTAMAERTGIAQGQISLILAGKVDPRLSTWVRLVRAVGVRETATPAGGAGAAAYSEGCGIDAPGFRLSVGPELSRRGGI